MRIFKLVAAVGLILSTAACAVYTRDSYPQPYYYSYHYAPPAVVYFG
jgi:hypothetical protein